LTWKRIAVVSALVLVLLAPFCICYAPAVTTTAQGGCHGMPEHQPTSTPVCCSVAPAAQPALATSVQYEIPSFLIAAMVVMPEPVTVEQRVGLAAIALSQSPPDTSSNLRI
jgi:hypothetical protein